MVAEPSQTASSIRDRYRKQRTRLGWMGAALSAIYLLILCAALALVGWSKFPSLKPNEIGDFLAGAFAPLAFFWLVIGYKQQSIELSLNTDTLVSQVEEMKQSVEQQTKQASALAAGERNAKRDLIAKLADLYLGRLSSFASVICHSLSVQGEWLPTGWQFYGSGDREFFFRLILVRHMELGGRDDGAAAAIHKSMTDRRDVTHAVQSFVAEYRMFIAQIRELDIDGVFVPAFDKGNVGRAYLIVEKALKRFEDGHPMQQDTGG